jgi:hypothetical protein
MDSAMQSLALDIKTAGYIIWKELEKMMLQGFQPDSLLRILSALLAFAGVTKLGPVRIRSFWTIEPYFR